MSGKDRRVATIMVTGGGSGGHITPVLAVAHELKQLSPGVRIVYIGQTGDSMLDVPAGNPAIDEIRTIRAGKFRRYHGEGWRQWLDMPTLAKNLRDALYVLVGIVQSLALLRRERPAVIFTRGSFVSVPVGLAAAWLKISFITHDSDAIPSLANRLVARWAAWHAVALPKEVYPYPAARTVTVGIPVSHHYTPADPAAKRAARQRLGLPVGADEPVVLVAGGGLGAQRLNEAVLALAPQLLTDYPKLTLVLQAGRANQTMVGQAVTAGLSSEQARRVQVLGYVTNMHDYSAAADVVICRAGGTNIAELSAQAKACIVVPNPQLTGGHQTKNAAVLADRQAAVVVPESALQARGKGKGPQALLEPLEHLLASPSAAQALGEHLHQLAQPDAAHTLATLIIDTAQHA